MLSVEFEGYKERVLLCDLHTHLGKQQVLDAGGSDAFRTATPSGLIDFYERLGYELVHRSQESHSASYKVSSPGKPTCPLHQILVEKTRSGQAFGWILDHAVCFPFNDVIAGKTVPKFQKSNDRVLLRTADIQYGRLIPFCRVDPFDGAKATKEVERCAQLGSKGLKLHPLSQGFIEKIHSEEVINLLELSASIGLPVIFDVVNEGVGADIGEVVDETKKLISSGSELKVILGHFGFDYTSEIMHELIQRPELVTELSGCRGDDVPTFFRNLIDQSGLAGIDKISYGSDYNYFGVPQCSDFILYVLSTDFRDLVGEENHMESVRKIFGQNALSLLPVFPNSSILRKQPEGLWKIPTGELADQIISISKERNFSVKHIQLDNNKGADSTLWTIRRSSGLSHCFFAHSLKDFTWIYMSEDVIRSKNLKKAFMILRENKTNDRLEKFNLRDFIQSDGGN